MLSEVKRCRAGPEVCRKKKGEPDGYLGVLRLVGLGSGPLPSVITRIGPVWVRRIAVCVIKLNNTKLSLSTVTKANGLCLSQHSQAIIFSLLRREGFIPQPNTSHHHHLLNPKSPQKTTSSRIKHKLSRTFFSTGHL